MTVDEKHYWRCAVCEAVLLDDTDLPPPDREKAHYLNHENDPDDPHYRRFLSKLAEPLAARLYPESSGLDYGCGPGPALAAMLRERGHRMRTYDPFFAPDADALAETYDFVTCSEVAEHFHNPAAEFERIDGLLKPGGWVGVMTCFRTQDDRFAAWHYRRDPTHVVFYKEETMRHIGCRFGWDCEIPAKDVALFGKPL
ncbi:class I SAM-dependent methyltransferase [Chelativorans sp. YIM 93263]|uniref:class I SAM-dependent methyltransferase n=1 Tax=Chelativorans sp. YIM 93263 TaxID=2906648 RepID=UPI0023791574|nr:class I SAM-dependent methyltransferase [Chelativorans sp. YIM 93263]